MRGIVIGAGRGQRLMPTTADAPKCFTRIGDRRILDIVLSALAGGGVEPITFVGGYRIGDVAAAYPQLELVENAHWATTNILGSLMCAAHRMGAGFVASYADIVYRRAPVAACVAAPHDITIVVDTDWRRRYVARSQHPPSDAEKVECAAGRVLRLHRDIDPDAAYGEFIGVAKFTAAGAAALQRAYAGAKARCGDGPFREAASVDRAYLIQLLQDMVEGGATIGHVDTHGGYHEIDTQQDYDLVREAYANGERWG
ncbi:MAG TPA: NTP transferase domain-containing protein [Nannocystaceae bacterium]|nr:NTP transferase domain-containing protein [Nannocystaceae bacterium]